VALRRPQERQLRNPAPRLLDRAVIGLAQLRLAGGRVRRGVEDPHPRGRGGLQVEGDPGAVRAKAYDLVLNGSEIGGGSVRIHDAALQARIFSRLGISDEEARLRFGFFLEALEYGTPPHGGIALGLDRIVAILAGETSIREVIAFPKTASAVDLMASAPSPVDAKQLRELHIRIQN